MRKALVLAVAAALLGSACSSNDSQSVSADGSTGEALNAEMVDGQVGADNGAPANADADGAQSIEALEAQERSSDGQQLETTPTEDSQTEASQSEASQSEASQTADQVENTPSAPSTNDTVETAPPDTVPILGVPIAPEGDAVVIEPEGVEIEGASITEVECYIEEFDERAGVDLMNGIEGEIDLSNPLLTDAVALQSGVYPGETLLAADSCLSPEARYEVAKNTPLLANFNQAQLDCMWPALQIVGQELADGLSLPDLMDAPSPEMATQINAMVACL